MAIRTLVKIGLIAASILALVNCGTLNSSQHSNWGNYQCEGERNIVVAFASDVPLAYVDISGDQFELVQQPAASGFYYLNEKVSIRGKGEDLMLTIGRMAPIRCQKQ